MVVMKICFFLMKIKLILTELLLFEELRHLGCFLGYRVCVITSYDSFRCFSVFFFFLLCTCFKHNKSFDEDHNFDRITAFKFSYFGHVRVKRFKK